MPTNLKAKDIANMIILSLAPKIESEGFQSYKAKQFVKMNDEVLLYINFLPYKNDIHIWYSVYPLCEHEIWLGAGVVADRFPKNEGGLKANTEEEIKIVLGELDKGLTDVFEFFRGRLNIHNIEKSISETEKVFSLLVKGVCLAYLGKPQEAKLFIDKFIDSGMRGGESRSGAEKLLAALADGTYQKLLEANKAANIKKLRLKKFLAK